MRDKLKLSSLFLTFLLSLNLFTFDIMADDRKIPIVNSSKYLVIEHKSESEIAKLESDDIIKSNIVVQLLSAVTALDKVKLDDVSLVDEQAVLIHDKYVKTHTSNVIGVNKGENIKIKDLIVTVLLMNAQDSLSVLASASNSSKEQFISAMNSKATELHLKNTSVSDLFIVENSNNLSTLTDLSKLMSILASNDELVKALNTKEISIAASNLNTTARNFDIQNPMLDKVSDKYYENYKFGIENKNNDSQVTFLSYSQRNDQSFITALSGNTDVNLNYSDTKVFFDWAFNNFKSEKLIDKDLQIAKYELPNKDTIPLVLEKNFYILRNQSDNLKLTDYSTKIQLNPMEGSKISKGDILGNAEIISNDKTLGNVNLVSDKDVDLLSLKEDNQENSFIKNFLTTILYSFLIIALFVFIIITINNIKKSKKKQKDLQLKREAYKKRKRTKIDFSNNKESIE